MCLMVPTLFLNPFTPRGLVNRSFNVLTSRAHNSRTGPNMKLKPCFLKGEWKLNFEKNPCNAIFDKISCYAVIIMKIPSSFAANYFLKSATLSIRFISFYIFHPTFQISESSFSVYTVSVFKLKVDRLFGRLDACSW